MKKTTNIKQIHRKNLIKNNKQINFIKQAINNKQILGNKHIKYLKQNRKIKQKIKDNKLKGLKQKKGNTLKAKNYLFENKLIEGTIVKRRNRFIMEVILDSKTNKGIKMEPIDCHCPTTGLIGYIEVEERPCLLSKSTNPNRKTKYTVEAISLNKKTDKDKKWIGINQNAANRYVEFYLKNGAFANMIGDIKDVRRERTLGRSKIDFVIGNNTFLEVKSFLKYLGVKIPDYIKRKKIPPFNSPERLVKHFSELSERNKKNYKSLLLFCYFYDHPGFTYEKTSVSKHYDEVARVFEEALESGVEVWQANFKIDKNGVFLKKYYKLNFD